ncbi:MAG: hypothetical protein K9N51_04595 [Candidatus Pacebacteria bacterium]|nr:hypothetical protein [Candidatus Paceibacterota bacterium]
MVPQVDIDWKDIRAVVVESDDWGVGEPGRGLETPRELETLYQVLESSKGTDGQPAVFTAFTCMSNPDYDAIRKNGFTEYADTWPAPTSEVARKWLQGIGRGVYFPEYHSNLHHTSPVVWMDLLRGKGPDSDRAKELFEKHSFAQGRHIPEFQGMTIKTMNTWIETGIARFTDTFGYAPCAAVTSDAYPETEVLWSSHGIQAVSLKNSRNNNGEVVVYDTKPWNNQDPWMPMGGFNRFYDLVYLSRNVFFECTQYTDQTPENVLPVIRTCWDGNEPAVLTSHRKHYVGGTKAEGLDKLAHLLQMLEKEGHVRFLTTAELNLLYRHGWSTRRHKNGLLVRKYDKNARVKLSLCVEQLISLPEGRDCSDKIADGGHELSVGTGDYIAITSP